MSTTAISIICTIIGFIVGFFASRMYFKRELRNNPPINEKMIRAMYREMGRQPNETQIRRIMKTINDQYK